MGFAIFFGLLWLGLCVGDGLNSIAKAIRETFRK